MGRALGSGSDDRRDYAVHVRLPQRPRCAEPSVDWAEPPLGLGYHRGHYEIIGHSADLDGLVRWVLGLGAGVEVLGPEVLRERIAEAARRIADQHSERIDVKKR